MRSRRMASSRIRASCILLPCSASTGRTPSVTRKLFRRFLTRSPSCLSKLSGVPSLAIALGYGILLHEELRRAHRPGVLDQVAHLRRVDRVEPHLHPVEAHVGLARPARASPAPPRR